jgi:hypothetical protein
VSERPKERASKAREGQPSAGSNPAATASLDQAKRRHRRWVGASIFAVVSNVVSIGPDWCVSAGPQEVPPGGQSSRCSYAQSLPTAITG